jgi:hypothetical protein
MLLWRGPPADLLMICCFGVPPPAEACLPQPAPNAVAGA